MFYNANKQVEGVRHDRINVVLVNAIKEQQDENQSLRTANAALNLRLRTIERTLARNAKVPRPRR